MSTLSPPLDAPLPASITGSGHGWFTRYRRYPVFSAPWARGRCLVLGSLFGTVLLLTLVQVALNPTPEFPWGGVAQGGMQLLLPLVVGPYLGLALRRRSWEADREWRALVALMLALVLGMLALHAWVAEPMKQFIAEATGQVDQNGKRKRVIMMVGLSVRSPDAAASQAPVPATTAASAVSAAAAGGQRACTDCDTAPDIPPLNRVLNNVTSAALTFFLAGGAGLWGWRRERAGLAALAREQELAQAQAQRREAELRLSVLAAQVEPRFLFNTLAGVRSAIATDPPRASEMIDRLVDYLRAAIPRLRSDGGAQATLGGQLDIVRAYLGLMAARMPRLSFAIDAPAELLAAPFPPLMLISLAENAVKHGVEPKIGPVRVTVQARRGDSGSLEVTVADDGAGFGASAGGSGLGLTNIRERLQQMHPGRGALTLRARPEGGVAAILSVPME
jgi:signal transduction histidine kinase